MAKGAKITISSGGGCVNHYLVEYKKTTENVYQNLYPNPTTDEFVVKDLSTGTYDFRIRKACCTGSISEMFLKQFIVS